MTVTARREASAVAAADELACTHGGHARGLPLEITDARYSGMFPIGWMGCDGIDLKGPIVLLCSRASDFMVGHNLVVDGGFTAW